MLDFEACSIASEMLRRAGFEHRHTSMKSEAAYYGWPGKTEVIRVASHKAHRAELNGIPVLATITFHRDNFKIDKWGAERISYEFVVKTVSAAIGRYFLTVAGVIKARARYRQYWEGGREELSCLEILSD